ncbi:MAG: trimeric intracellular cation channel family protein, partial [Hyphomicrobiales bacterium]
MFDTVTFALDWLGIVAFAVTGALVASRKEMDLFGFALLATVTGIGGGTLRDLLLGVPVFWVREPSYLIVCVIVSSVMFVIAHVPTSRYRVLLWVDALGLALFAVAGAERALLASASPVVAVTMGVVTATFGGIIRDLLGGETPVILSREIYVSAALA